MTPVPPAHAVRAELAEAIDRFEESARTETTVRFTGELFAGPALVGPPGRVHGGLHPVLRLAAPLERLTGRALSSHGPVVLECALYRAIPLETKLAFEGELEHTSSGFRLFTRVGGTERLDAWARSLAPEEAAIDLEPWREAMREDLTTAEMKTFLVRGSVPLRVGRRLVSMHVDDAFFALENQEIARYRREDGTFDTAFVTMALDVVGACTAGFAWNMHLFTTRLEVVLVREPSLDAGPLVVLGDLRGLRPRTGSTLPTVTIDGVERAETELPVVLARADLEEVFAHGVVTIYPATNR
jgi:hypothetical protein